MRAIELSGDWRMAAERETQGAKPYESACSTEGWLSVRLPTTVQAALVENAVVPSPWLDRQVRALEAFGRDTWWFRREFTLSADERKADQYELVLEGVQLYCTAWLNGAPVGFTHNAHHAHRFDVTAFVKRDEANVLALECRLDPDAVRRRVRSDVSRSPEEIRPYVRTCQMSFGWDFAPRLPLIGPWRPVHVVCHQGASLEDMHVRTDAIEGADAFVTVEVATRVFRAAGAPPTVHLCICSGPDGPPVWEGSLAAPAGFPVRARVRIPSARLWYPYPIGEPFLYTLEAQVEFEGQVTDRRSERFGVRTVALEQENRFTFCINGVDVFARGANWVPSNSLTLDNTRDGYRRLVGLAHEARFNMLRVWGGGIYESETFYDLCDQMGIMVWQDFMYACAMYPDDDPEFMASAAREAREVVTRLRRHPCVVLWCGSNECQEAWELGDWAERAPRHLGERLYDHLLPDTVRHLSPEVPYWPGSPFGGATTRSREVGDFHDWYSFPNWRGYQENAPRFSSEYGFRSVPHRRTVEAMISPQYQWDPHGPQNALWGFHHGDCGWMNAIVPEFGSPQTLDEYIMLTQEAQATLMRYALEVYRRRMFDTSGSLIWQYNEPWPAVTFSLVDFFGRAKAAYYWVRHAHAPVIGMFYRNGDCLEYWGISDLPEPRDCTVRMRRFRHSGALAGEFECAAPLKAAGATRLLEQMPAALRLESPEDEFIHAELRCGETSTECLYHAALRKDWRLPPTCIEASACRVAEGCMRLTLQAAEYAHWVNLSVEDPWARYSDNFVDLLPGEPRTIEVRARGCYEITVAAANAPVVVLAVR